MIPVLDMEEMEHVQNCSRDLQFLPVSIKSSGLSQMLLLDKKTRKGDRRQSNKPLTKPSISKLPESDVISRMKAFLPMLSAPLPTPESSQDSAVQFIPISDSDDSSDDDNPNQVLFDKHLANQSRQECDTQQQTPCVEMRLALAMNSDSDSDPDSDTVDNAIGPVTEANLNFPGASNLTKVNIEELN